MPGEPSRIHPMAIVDAGAELAADVTVGPYAVVGRGCRLGSGCVVMAHAIVDGVVEVGARNVFHPFCVVGGAPQVLRHDGGPAPVVLGDGNTVREHVTIHGGTQRELGACGVTKIGSHNLLMAGCHIAHDAEVGSACVVANSVQIAGHAIVEDGVTFGGLSAVAQFVRIGEGAFVAGGAMCERDVPPFVIVQGDRARIRALNVVGLRRRAVPPVHIAALRRAFRALFAGGGSRAEALANVRSGPWASDPYVVRLCDALDRSSRRAR